MLDLQLVTMSGTKLERQVYEVILPTMAGEISVFPGHEPLVGVAVPGVITVRLEKDGDDLDYYAISGGVIEINQTGVRVLVDEADHGEDIVEADTQAALDRALALRDSAQTQLELEHAHKLVDRHAVRLKVADLRRRSRRRR